MRNGLGGLLLLSLFLVSCAADEAPTLSGSFVKSADHDNVVYGDDNRVDYFEIKNPLLKEISKSTVAIVLKDSLIDMGNETSRIASSTLEETIGLCDNQRYAEEKVVSLCSGSLIAEDLVLTAGHCVETQEMCDKLSFVFDFRKESETDSLERLTNKNIFNCQSLVAQKSSLSGDYAIIRLDRKVNDRQPLSFRVAGEPKIGDELAIIGYPSGMSLKVADDAQVLAIGRAYFVADLDSFSGNSGSPVVNIKTGLIEGVLSHGEKDYIARRLNKKTEADLMNQELAALFSLVHGDRLDLRNHFIDMDNTIVDLVLDPSSVSDAMLLAMNDLTDKELEKELVKLPTNFSKSSFKNLLSKEQIQRNFAREDVKVCYEIKVCAQDQCRGEKVSKAKLIVVPLIDEVDAGNTVLQEITNRIESRIVP